MEVVRRSLVVALVLASCRSGPEAKPSEEELAPAFEVCVVGTIHAPWQFRWQGISPAHVRAALVKLEPDVIGVESNPEWFAKGVFHEVTFEAQSIAIPFAKARDIPVYGIDWMDQAAWDRRVTAEQKRRIRSIQGAIARRWLPTAMLGEQSPAYLATHSELRQFFFKKDMSFAHVNQIDGDGWAKQWLKGGTTAVDFGGHRNREIVKHCVQVMKKHREKRLVVVIGAGHKAVLDVLFGRMPGVKVLRLGKEVPAPTAAEIAAAETVGDLVVTLGHNLDGERSCFHRELIDMDRMGRLIDKLREIDGRKEHAEYFAARLAYLKGDPGRAQKALSRIGDQEPKAKLYPFPMRHWRMVYSFDQAVRVARAEVAFEMNAPRLAAKRLAGLADEIRVPDLPKSLFDRGELVREVSAVAQDWSANSTDLALNPRALFLVAEQKAKPKRGMAALTRRLHVAENGRLRIELSVRARNRARGAIEVYERDEANGGLKRLGTHEFTTGPRWDSVGADFHVRDATRPIWLFVYLDAQVGTRFGVRNIAIHKRHEVTIPQDWISRTLARQYILTLLAK